jgi:mannose-6-phosphate isomerase-like protein (cupin superfamily)
MFFSDQRDAAVVEEVTNLSTGYCPEPESWPVVGDALDRLGVVHPGRFTTQVIFRRCPVCGERNVVKDGWFKCQVCGGELPRVWNFGTGEPAMPISNGFHGSFGSWIEKLPTPEGKPFVIAYEHGTLSVEMFAPRGVDTRTPHRRDEVYMVVRGDGYFVNGPDRHRFGPGDLLFVPAGGEHRFEEFTDDLAVWVIFYGPDGGEHEEAGR